MSDRTQKAARPLGNEAEAESERAFNETLKRMLKTPPKPHEKATPLRPKDKLTAARDGQKSNPT